VKAWAGGVSDALDDAGLHILINNAGILTPGPIELLPLDAIRHEFDVNVFGALSVINAFLPALRKARGRIVQVSTWTGSVALGQYFGQVTREHERARVVVHKIIAVGDYVFAHVNFLNLLTDDPEDTGIAGVDIYKMDANGVAIEHWDTLQLVGNPTNSAPWVAPKIPRANPHGMF
jgi:predicted SnoaL-like aldol condensation-catalyzing enzyme